MDGLLLLLLFVLAFASLPASGARLPPDVDRRMGSFTSAPKMVNDDHQDDDVEFGAIETFEALRDRCRDELKELPARIERHFPKARTSNASTIRLFQWNILSQCNFHSSCSLESDSFSLNLFEQPSESTTTISSVVHRKRSTGARAATASSKRSSSTVLTSSAFK